MLGRLWYTYTHTAYVRTSHPMSFDRISLQPPPLKNKGIYSRATPLRVSHPLPLLHTCQLSHAGPCGFTRASTVCICIHTVFLCIYVFLPYSPEQAAHVKASISRAHYTLTEFCFSHPPLKNIEIHRKATPLRVSHPLPLLHTCQLSHPGAAYTSEYGNPQN